MNQKLTYSYKFKYAIHKDAQTLFTYEDWLQLMKENKNIIRICKFEASCDRYDYLDKPNTISYKPIDIVLSNDFEIIYDNGFTTNELKEMMWSMDTSANDNKYTIIDKLDKEIKARHNIEQRFGVEWEDKNER
ncbi:hypothetical protein FC831_10435 [Clostridium botulinum]|nr:hypothetical protein [Clostridium botulinum]